MGLIDRLNSWVTASPSRTTYDDLATFSFNGNQYLVGALNQTLSGKTEDAEASFSGLVQQAYLTNSVVFACELARLQLFSEARFQYQRLRNGRPAELFGDPSLSILEHPWPTAITGDLLTRVLIDADLGGTAFMAKRGRSAIRRLRPDWVTMILGSEQDVDVQAGDIDADVLGVAYYPGGKYSGREPEFIQRDQLAIFAPNPDPLGMYRGIPWVLPVIREIIADKQLTDHKSQYLVNGATPNLTVAVDKDLKEAANPKAFLEWIEAFKKVNSAGGSWDKYKTWYLAGGTVVTKVGSNMQEVDFKQVQGAGETRIAAAAGVPPVIVGLSEGLQAATYSNYGQARRRFADNTMRPLWRNFAGSLETIVPPPPGARLWYDDRDIQALAEDKKDLAEVRQLESQQIRTLVDGGYKPESVVEAVTNGDFSRLVHTGLFSVQLQPPQPDGPPKPPAPPPPPLPPKRDEELIALLSRPQPITVTISEGAVRNESPVTISEGAVRVDSPVTVERTEVHIDDGAVRVDAPVTIAEGAVHAPVTVERTEVTIAEGAVRVDAPVTVERQDITVEPSTITVEQPDITVQVPEQRPTTKTVTRDKTGQITSITEVPDGE